MYTPIYDGPPHCADRLRILIDELRCLGAKRWILTALHYLADELEDAEVAAREDSARPEGGISTSRLLRIPGISEHKREKC
jgi:hypothetical protein